MIVVTEPSNKKIPPVKRVVGYVGEDLSYKPMKNESVELRDKNDSKERIKWANKILFVSLIYYTLVLLLSHYTSSNVTLTLGAATVLFPGVLNSFV